MLAAALAGFFVAVMPSPAAETNTAKHGPKYENPEEVYIQLKLRKWTKLLDLTAEQQKKVLPLCAEEADRVAKLRADKSIPISAQPKKMQEIHADIVGKLKPLLAPAQVEKLEATMSKDPARKK